MKLKELKDRIDSQIRIMMQAEEAEVVIRVYSSGSIGPSPTVGVKSAGYGGFDWDSGKYIILPDQPLATAITNAQRDRRTMRNARRIMRAKKVTNRYMYMTLFDAGWDEADERCKEMGLDPDSYEDH